MCICINDLVQSIKSLLFTCIEGDTMNIKARYALNISASTGDEYENACALTDCGTSRSI